MKKNERFLILLCLVFCFLFVGSLFKPAPVVADQRDRTLERMAKASEDQARSLQQIAKELAEIKRGLK